MSAINFCYPHSNLAVTVSLCETQPRLSLCFCLSLSLKRHWAPPDILCGGEVIMVFLSYQPITELVAVADLLLFPLSGPKCIHRWGLFILFISKSTDIKMITSVLLSPFQCTSTSDPFRFVKYDGKTRQNWSTLPYKFSIWFMFWETSGYMSLSPRIGKKNSFRRHRQVSQMHTYVYTNIQDC